MEERILRRGPEVIKMVPDGLVWTKELVKNGKVTRKTFSITNFLPELKRLKEAGFVEA